MSSQHQMLSPGDQAQIQMSQQMTQMMQMQMQWMQQMMQMQAMQAGHPVPNNNDSFLGPPGPPGQTPRPISMASNAFTNSMGVPQVDQRTLSLLDPSMSSKWNNLRPSSFIPTLQGSGSINKPGATGELGYAHSIAPSERSNVGTASRYRPVSTIQLDVNNTLSARSSTFTASTLRPWTEEPRKLSLSSLSVSSPSRISKDTSVASMTAKPVGDMAPASLLAPNGRFGTNVHATSDDDDDDDEGWAEMVQMREKKRSTWKFKKAPTAFGDLVHHTDI
jgi:hypothetical protein